MDRLVPDAFVNVVFWSDVLPVAIRSPTVADPALKVLALSVPPVAIANWISPLMLSEVPVAFVNVVF
jgi:hypothetical protein